MLHPPADAVHPWAPVEVLQTWGAAHQNHSPSPVTPGVSFIEAVRLVPPLNASNPPGSLILALSHGSRLRSWWSAADDHVNHLADHDYDEDIELD